MSKGVLIIVLAYIVILAFIRSGMRNTPPLAA